MTQPFTFIHASDLHLDTPFSGVEASAPEVAAILRDATLKAFDNLISLCLEREAAFLLIAGDLYDGQERGVRGGIKLREGFKRLEEAGVQVFIATGNHDPHPSELGRMWSAYGELPQNVKIFPTKAQSFPVVRGGELLATVSGISYSKREELRDLAAQIKGAGEGFQVGVVHATIGPTGEHAPYAPTSMEHLTTAGIDYWALGHLHTRTLVSKDSPSIVYPGNLQALTRRERGAHGAFAVEVSQRAEVTLDFTPLDTLRFAYPTCDISGKETIAEIEALLASVADDEAKAAEGRALILSVKVTGVTSLHSTLSDPATIVDLLSLLREEESFSSSPLWWNSIELATSPEVDLKRLLSLGGVEAQIITVADDLISKADVDLLDELYSRSGITRFLSSPPSGEIFDLEVACARDLLLSMLSEEER
ncbi:MAG: hypothetical protein C0608_03490 [Deltaproteobacteria bacterium]|nr:MAG: hypothetical protein C0608_03490 [Deltaproteobacteria bacterium]